MLSTPKGKIARLPRTIREQVNLQLDDGRPARHILAWLNADSAVMAIMNVEFNGQPVSESNLSEWRRGGFRHWQNERNADATIQKVASMQQPEADALQLDLTDRMHLLYIAHMFADIKELDALPSTGGKAALWREMRLGLIAMRRFHFDTLRFKDKLGGKTDDDAPMTDEERQAAVARILGISDDVARINPETDRFEGPDADALNAQRDELKAAAKAAREAGLNMELGAALAWYRQQQAQRNETGSSAK